MRCAMCHAVRCVTLMSRWSFMLLTLLRLVATRNRAYSQSRYPTFDASMKVPVLTEKNLPQPPFLLLRQRLGIVGCEPPVWMLSWPQCGQQIPPCQRCATNHCSAAALSGNSWKNRWCEIPLRCPRPGPLLVRGISTSYTLILPDGNESVKRSERIFVTIRCNSQSKGYALLGWGSK